MNDLLEKVQNFQHRFNAPVLSEPTIIGTDRFNLRMNLIFEEVDEIVVAQGRQDKVELLDGMVDTAFVLMGLILETGFADVFDAAFEEVYQSNMSKTCKTEEEAIATIQHMDVTHGWLCDYEPHDGVFVVKRKSDGKIMKSINYFKPNLTQFIKN